MAPQQAFLNGLANYLANCPADDVLRRVLIYCKAHLTTMPRIVFRESYTTSYPPDCMVIGLGPVDSGEVHLTFGGFYVELRHTK